MKTTFFKNLIVLTFSVFSITAVAQCPTITNMNVALGANGTATLIPVLSGTVSNQTFYYWQSNPNATQVSAFMQASSEFQFPANGTYTVCLNYSDSLNGCWSNAFCSVISISNMAPSSCNSSFTTYTDSSCGTHFNNTSTGSNLNYKWFINGAMYFNTDPIVNLPDGSYPVILETYSGSLFCDSSYQVVNVACSFTINCQPAFVAYPDTINCTTTFVNQSTGTNMNYQWFDYTNNIYTFLSSTVSPVLNLSNGVHSIILRVFSNGQYCDSLVQNVTVNCAGNPFSNCFADSQFYVFADSLNAGNYYAYNTSSASGTVSYLWNFGDGTSSTQQYPFHQYAIPGQYVICLTVTATSGTTTCSDAYCDSSSVQRMAAGFQMSQFNVIPLSVTGIKQSEKEIGLNAFPNPISDELTIEATVTNDTKLTYALTDAIGRIIMTGNLNTSKTTIYTGNLEKGFYSLNISNVEKGLLKTIKLVK